MSINEIEEVFVYKTTDNKLFINEEEAVKHQSILNFDRAYEKESIFGTCSRCHADLEDLKEWLLRNKEVVKEFLDSN